LQHCLAKLKDGGTCAIVLDEGVLFRTNEDDFVKTKRKLLNDCRVEAIVSLPGGVFTQAGAGVKTNILIFSKGRPTRTIWYYDLAHLNVRKRSPLTMADFAEILRLYPGRRRATTVGRSISTPAKPPPAARPSRTMTRRPSWRPKPRLDASGWPNCAKPAAAVRAADSRTITARSRPR
jgi:type I restriction-modification system DNA methylase subunit